MSLTPDPVHSLRPVDVEFMKALHEKVNTIPLIAKADCLTPTEIKKLKDRVSPASFTARSPRCHACPLVTSVRVCFLCVRVQIREEIDKFGIKVYQLPECDSDEDEEFKQLDKELKVSVCTQIYPLLLLYNGLIRFSLEVKNAI